MKPKLLVIRDENVSLVHRGDYMLVSKNGKTEVVAYTHIDALFIASGVDVKIRDLMYMCQKFPIWLIDGNGVLKASLRKEQEYA